MKRLKLDFEHGNFGVRKRDFVDQNVIDINVRNIFYNYKVDNDGLIYMDGFIETLIGLYLKR